MALTIEAGSAYPLILGWSREREHREGRREGGKT
jgi:hypothetical protein